MSKDTDVYADHTVEEKQKQQSGTSESAAPGEKAFKEKDNSHRHGFTNVPGAGPNPGK